MTETVGYKAENIAYLILYRKGLLIPGLGCILIFHLEDGMERMWIQIPYFLQQ